MSRLNGGEILQLTNSPPPTSGFPGVCRLQETRRANAVPRCFLEKSDSGKMAWFFKSMPWGYPTTSLFSLIFERYMFWRIMFILIFFWGGVDFFTHYPGGFKYFLFSSLPAEMIQFDEHIFRRGWNHQLGIPFLKLISYIHWKWMVGRWHFLWG